MKKHISTLIVLLLIGVGLCSCASNPWKKFGKEEIIYFKEITIKDNIKYEVNKPWLAIVRDGEESCFKDKKEGTITVRADNLEMALQYFYNSRATWNIKRIQKPNHHSIETYANSEMQIKYEVMYCKFVQINAFRDFSDLYASFRLVNPPQIINGDEK